MKTVFENVRFYPLIVQLVQQMFGKNGVKDPLQPKTSSVMNVSVEDYQEKLIAFAHKRQVN